MQPSIREFKEDVRKLCPCAISVQSMPGEESVRNLVDYVSLPDVLSLVDDLSSRLMYEAIASAEDDKEKRDTHLSGLEALLDNLKDSTSFESPKIAEEIAEYLGTRPNIGVPINPEVVGCPDQSSLDQGATRPSHEGSVLYSEARGIRTPMVLARTTDLANGRDIASLQDKVRYLKDRLNDVEKDLRTTLKSWIDQSRSQLADAIKGVQRDYEETEGRLEIRIAHYVDQLASLGDHMNSLGDHMNEEFKRQTTATNATRDDNNKFLREFGTELDGLGNQLEDLTSRMNEAETDIIKLECEDPDKESTLEKLVVNQAHIVEYLVAIRTGNIKEMASQFKHIVKQQDERVIGDEHHKVGDRRAVRILDEDDEPPTTWDD